MRQALYLTGRTAILALGVALSAGAQAPPAKPATPQSAKPTAGPATQPAPAAKTQAAKPTVAPKPAAPAAKPVQAVPKPKAAAPVKKETQKPAKAAAAPPKKEEAAPAPTVTAHRRDPFVPLLAAAIGPGTPVHLPPGPGGLQVSTLRVQGVVRSPNGMLAVISNPQGRTYFLHQGARLFDGKVEQISMDAVTFQETGKDPFGKAIDRTVVKRIYASAGEQ